ncbi:urease accessory protein UreE [Lichenihabitans sp. PAMC28606]|uniref:urease accessory protein UreE n=1 Tax=Lichenihabitans sp. PAMC28606 TaxID=2880932 RepID=UPI001D0B960C|nr:urease accessory protein UreE [Lichenihabitans sp. PAMC28606]UDL94245.1 urease accessory protein UreE [Lichenihabitans sp. PAMC28606]
MSRDVEGTTVMARAIAVKAQHEFGAAMPADTVVLDFADRNRPGLKTSGVRGLAIEFDLPEAIMLRGGDALVLDDGRLVDVVAAPEQLIELRSRTPGDLVRAALQIGSRHLAAQVLPNGIRLRPDAAIETVLAALGVKITSIETSFDPEGGAYAASAHDHDHHDHDHHGHDHAGHGHEAHGHKADDHKHHDHDHGGHDHDHHHPHD